MSTTLGTKLKLTIFGESHGVAIGGVIDGILPGVKLDMDYIEAVMKRRMPGQNDMSTPRKEADKAEILSGVFSVLFAFIKCIIIIIYLNTNLTGF